MRPPRPRSSRRLTLTVRTLLAVVFLSGIGLGIARHAAIEPYRREWRVEQEALAELRARYGQPRLGYSKVIVGPPWVRRIAGPGQARYFERVGMLHCVTSSPKFDECHRLGLKHVWAIIQD